MIVLLTLIPSHNYQSLLVLVHVWTDLRRNVPYVTVLPHHTLTYTTWRTLNHTLQILCPFCQQLRCRSVTGTVSDNMDKSNKSHLQAITCTLHFCQCIKCSAAYSSIKGLMCCDLMSTGREGNHWEVPSLGLALHSCTNSSCCSFDKSYRILCKHG